eukprot:Trichotokara_eunicae@DN3644_c0_g1_i1.p1
MHPVAAKILGKYRNVAPIANDESAASNAGPKDETAATGNSNHQKGNEISKMFVLLEKKSSTSRRKGAELIEKKIKFEALTESDLAIFPQIKNEKKKKKKKKKYSALI